MDVHAGLSLTWSRLHLLDCKHVFQKSVPQLKFNSIWSIVWMK